MKNIKEITLLVFAIIGFYAIFTGFTKQEKSTSTKVAYETPESHVWEIYGADGKEGFLLNKVTGEVKAITIMTQTLVVGNVIQKK